MRYLLDSNVVSETRRRGAAPQVLTWLESAPIDDLCVSVLVIGELRHDIERLRTRDPRQAAILEPWLTDLRERFDDRTIPVDREIAEAWGPMRAATRVPTVDGPLAATAKVRGIVVVTRNVADFACTGVAILNPWDPPSP